MGVDHITNEGTALLSEDPKKNKESLSVFLIKRSDTWGDSVKLKDPLKVIVSEFNQLNAKFETALMMHKLTATYFSKRAFWFTFFPLLLVTTGVSICGFVKTGDTDESTVIDGDSGFFNSTIGSTSDESSGIEFDQDTVSLIIGLLGVLSTALASLGKHLNYQSKADMHSSAVLTLRGILDDVSFERLDAKHKKRLHSCRGKNNLEIQEEELRKLRVDIEVHRSKFDTMEKSCTVPIPFQIKNAFIDLEEHCQLLPRTVRDTYYRRYYNELNNAFQTTGFSAWFQCFLPNVDVCDKFGQRIKSDVQALWVKKASGAVEGESMEDRDDSHESGEKELEDHGANV